MKILKSRYVKKGPLKGELLKLKELTLKDQQRLNVTSNYIVTIGEYDDVDWEEDNLQACIDFYNCYEA